MIAHVSVPARDPRATSLLLAALLDGEADPALAPDGPAAMPWEDQIFPGGRHVRASAFHFAMSTPLSDEQVLELAREAGLRAIYCDRGGVFGVVEVWLDNTILLEVPSPREVERYRRFMNPEGVTPMFGEGVRPAPAA